jgi:hypothetical protein
MARTRGAAQPFLLPVLSLRRLKELANKHGPDAIEELARLARKAESEAARVAACREILDRGYRAGASGLPATASTRAAGL